MRKKKPTQQKRNTVSEQSIECKATVSADVTEWFVAQQVLRVGTAGSHSPALCFVFFDVYFQSH